MKDSKHASQSGKSDNTLIKAARAGDVGKIREALAQGANVNTRTAMGERSGLTPLMLACDRGSAEAVRTLLKAGADVNLTDASDLAGEGGRTALHYSVVLDEEIAERQQIVRELVEARADPNRVDNGGNTPVMKAAGFGQTEIVATLLAAGADPSLCSANGGPALHWAANDGHEEVIAQLLASGVDVNVRDQTNGTALMTAAYRGQEGVIDLLLVRKADPSLVDNAGRSALTYAAFYARDCFTDNEHQKALRIVKRLVESGTPLNCKDNEGQTVLDYAAEGSRSLVADFLKERGAKAGSKVSQ